MSNTPLISVLMPAYNAEMYIEEAIQSILNQTFTDFELIIVNDGSTDRTEEIILSFDDKRIRYTKNKTNLRLIASLNKSIELARGKYIARMDADDISLPNRFRKQVQFLETHLDYALCSSWAYLINEKGEKTGRIKLIDNNNLLKINLLFTNPFVHPATMIRTDTLRKFNYNPAALHNEDFDLWLRMANDRLKMTNIPEFLIKYRWHNSNISVVNEDYQIREKYQLLSPYLHDFLARPLSEKELDLHLFSFRLYHLGQKRNVSEVDLQNEKQWLLILAQRNNEIKKYPQADFDAFLWSRWIVCCIFTKKIFSIFNIKLPWYKPSVIYKTIKLLLYK